MTRRSGMRTEPDGSGRSSLPSVTVSLASPGGTPPRGRRTACPTGRGRPRAEPHRTARSTTGACTLGLLTLIKVRWRVAARRPFGPPWTTPCQRTAGGSRRGECAAVLGGVLQAGALRVARGQPGCGRSRRRPYRSPYSALAGPCESSVLSMDLSVGASADEDQPVDLDQVIEASCLTPPVHRVLPSASAYAARSLSPDRCWDAMRYARRIMRLAVVALLRVTGRLPGRRSEELMVER